MNHQNHLTQEHVRDISTVVRRWSCGCALSVMLLLSACATGRTLAPAAGHKAKHTACVACHRMVDPSVESAKAFPQGIDPADLCHDCHHYAQNHHPIDIVPSNISTKQTLDTFPLHEGRITCLTCHVAHSGPSLRKTPKLLRGGPYDDRRDICFRCHFAESYTSIDPHRMLDAAGNIREQNGEPVCLLCHRTTPGRGTAPADVSFKADIAFLCWRCHPPMPGTFMQSHFHRKPKGKTLQVMRGTERSNAVALPLAGEGVISCSTCHNPHQSGVLENGSAQSGADAPNKLRLSKNDLCAACHAVK